MIKLLKHHREALKTIERKFGVRPVVVRQTNQGSIIVRVGNATAMLNHSGNRRQMTKVAVNQLQNRLKGVKK